MEEKHETECKNPLLCIALGFFLPLVGLILAAIIGKGTGLKHALAGVVLRYGLAIASCVYVFRPGESSRRTKTTPAVSASKQTTKRTWQVTKKKSPIDDSTTYIVTREAEERVGIAHDHPKLVIRRDEDASDVYIVWPCQLASSKIPVTIRFDSHEAITEEWTTSTTGKSAFSPFVFGELLNSLLNSKRLVVRLTPYGKSPETVTFDLSGLADVFDEDMVAALADAGDQ